MDISQLEVSTVTSMDLVGVDGRPTGITITGHTPDSKEWRAAQREYAPKGQDNLSMRVQRKGDSTVDLPNDPNAHENRIKRLASVVTNITGLTNAGQPWIYSPENVLTLFSNDGCGWIVDQWEDHMDDRKNFLNDAEKPANSGSGASAGSTPIVSEPGSTSPDLDLTSNG